MAFKMKIYLRQLIHICVPDIPTVKHILIHAEGSKSLIIVCKCRHLATQLPLGEEGWEVARRAERRHADALRLLEIKLNEGLLEG